MVGVTILSTLDFRLDAPLSMSSTISGLDMEEEGSEDGAIEETGGAEEDSNEEEGSALEEGVSLLREEQAVIEKTKASVIKVQINAFIVNFLSK